MNLADAEKGYLAGLADKAGWKCGTLRSRGNKDKNWAKAWVLQIYRIDEQKKFLNEIGPLITGKAEQVKIAQSFLRRRKSGRMVKPSPEDRVFMDNMKALNRRGFKSGSVETKRAATVHPQLKLWSELRSDAESPAEMTGPLQVN